MYKRQAHARGHLLFEPCEPRVDGAQIAGERFVAELQETQLRIRAAVDAHVHVRRRALERGADGDEPRTVGLPQKAVHRLAVVATREQRRAALGSRFGNEQVACERGQLAEHRAHILAAAIEPVRCV